jgi:hypothetical protein
MADGSGLATGFPLSDKAWRPEADLIDAVDAPRAPRAARCRIRPGSFRRAAVVNRLVCCFY